MPPTPQFLNMDEAINCVVSAWTPWKNPTLGNFDGELSIGQIFPSKIRFVTCCEDVFHKVTPKVYYL